MQALREAVASSHDTAVQLPRILPTRHTQVHKYTVAPSLRCWQCRTSSLAPSCPGSLASSLVPARMPASSTAALPPLLLPHMLHCYPHSFAPSLIPPSCRSAGVSGTPKSSARHCGDAAVAEDEEEKLGVGRDGGGVELWFAGGERRWGGVLGRIISSLRLLHTGKQVPRQAPPS